MGGRIYDPTLGRFLQAGVLGIFPSKVTKIATPLLYNGLQRWVTSLFGRYYQQ